MLRARYPKLIVQMFLSENCKRKCCVKQNSIISGLKCYLVNKHGKRGSQEPDVNVDLIPVQTTLMEVFGRTHH